MQQQAVRCRPEELTLSDLVHYLIGAEAADPAERMTDAGEAPVKV